MDTIAVIIFGLCCFFAYIIPGIIASTRKHKNSGAILALNLLLGWTFIGWVICLVWSLTANVDQR
jgi:hypothetical protein